MEPVATIISASRRTDIPAFHMGWFMDAIERGTFEVTHPFTRRVVHVPATAPPVHTIVFWSKDFGPFLADACGRRLVDRGYHLFFQFTVNPENPLLEPRVPALSRRLAQMERLCRDFGPRAVNWRLDPICFYHEADGRHRVSSEGAGLIADAAAACGIRSCTASVMDPYRKIARRTARLPGVELMEVPRERALDALVALEALLRQRGIALVTCCENALLEHLPPGSGIRPGACIPSDLLMELYGGSLSLKRDPGQRSAAGCGCRVSVDVGSYDRHACAHGCLYCYASPAAARSTGQERS
jgi:hypothetical protein